MASGSLHGCTGQKEKNDGQEQRKPLLNAVSISSAAGRLRNLIDVLGRGRRSGKRLAILVRKEMTKDLPRQNSNLAAGSPN